MLNIEGEGVSMRIGFEQPQQAQSAKTATAPVKPEKHKSGFTAPKPKKAQPPKKGKP